jgi:uncharacterized protein (TIGR02598 family)
MKLRYPLKINKTTRAAFSLVEVVLALGVVSFAMMGLVGLIPVGLQTSREAINITVESQIVQSLAGDLQLADYSKLAGGTFHFDEQGTAVAVSDPDRLYTVAVTPQATRSPAGLSAGAAQSVLIEVTNRSNPRQMRSYNVLVFNNNR